MIMQKIGKYLLYAAAMAIFPCYGAEFEVIELKELPTENRVTPELVSFWTPPDENDDYKIPLSNGLELVISPLYSEPTEAKIELGEDHIFIKAKDKPAALVARGWGFGDFMKEMILDKDNRRIYIRETKWDNLQATFRKHDLMCTKTECAFFTKDCLFKPDHPQSAAEIEKEMIAEVEKSSELSSELKEKYIGKLFIAAMSGDKDNIKFFLNRDHLNQYFHFDAGISEGYGIDKDLLAEYGKKCFSDETIK